ncbi:putative cytochrome P450 alkane hydroxylase [Xylariomycetidae sp. FL2044]|nr:putative cytochrome P450 alkane hydroxylase [Xylariomycetidae sp. FL2044]
MTISSWKTHTTLELFHWKYNSIGRTYESATVGLSPIIFTVDPENLKTILATDFQKWDLGPRRRKLLSPLVGKGIFTSDGQAWEHSRSLIRPSFTKLRMTDVSLFEIHFQNFLSILPPENPVSGLIDVDLQPLVFRMTLDSATDVLIGRSFESQLQAPSSSSRAFMEAFDYAQLKTHLRYLMDRGLMKPLGMLLKLLYPNLWNQFDNSCTTVHSVIDDVVADLLQSYDHDILYKDKDDEAKAEPQRGNKKYVFLEELAKETHNPIELRDEILNVLVAGRDTTASLLSNALFALARHPDVWDRVRAEVIETIGDELPKYETLRNLRQLRNLFNECLRLWPPVPINSREANVDTILPRGGGPDGGSPIFVRAGQSVNYYLYSLHRLPEIFGEDAEVFRPERWDDPKLRPGWGYIPFNGGPRICPGQQFALTEASYMLVRLMQHVTFIERRDPVMQWQERVALVTKARNGVKVALKMTERE